MTGTGNSVAVREPSGALAIQDGQVSWDPMQLAALAQLGIKDASDGDKQVFLHVSQRTGLDPFARQIYMIGRNEKLPNGQWGKKWTIQTGIEGWRVIRDRAERRYGLRGILSRFTYYGSDGTPVPVWVQKLPPVACEVTYTVVESGGREVPYTSVLRFSEYVQMKDGKAIAQWAPDAKPVHMLEKCTEADAYRKAFPQDYSGVVLDDAMPPADADPPQERPRVTGEQARARAPQQVRSEVVTVTPDAPREVNTETGEVIPDGGGQRAEDDPRAAVLAAFDALLVPGPEIPAYLTRLSGHSYASVESLSHAAAGWFADRLGKLGSRDELEAAAVAAEARREQDSAAEAGDAPADGEVPAGEAREHG